MKFFSFCADHVDLAVPSLLCGDFNSVFDRALDRRGSASLSCRESSTALKNLFDALSVSDVWRSLHPDTVAFTWLKPDGSYSSRIDLFGCPFSWPSPCALL